MGNDVLEIQVVEVSYHLLNLSRFETVLKSNKKHRDLAISNLKSLYDNSYSCQKKLNAAKANSQQVVDSSLARMTRELQEADDEYESAKADYESMNNATKVPKHVLSLMVLISIIYLIDNFVERFDLVGSYHKI
jgi:hypothetical protein